MKLSVIAAVAAFSALAMALPGGTTTTTAAGGYGGSGSGSGGSGSGGSGSGGSGGSGGGTDTKSTCYPYTYFSTSSGYTEYPSTIVKTDSIPFTHTLTSYQTIETLVPSSYVTTIITNIPSKTVKEFYSTSTGYKLATQSSVTTIKSSWTSVGSTVSSTCKAGGGYGGGW